MTHILVALHHPGMQRTLAELLRRRILPSRVEVLALGECLADWLDSNDAGIVIVDWRSPDGCAGELIRAIKFRHPKASVICLSHCLSSEDVPEYREIARRWGADKFCATSASLEHILAQVQGAVGESYELRTNATDCTSPA
ncbi:MAG: hypothetical protein ACR2RL_10835 [Gammaproteobacteria bacterium]